MDWVPKWQFLLDSEGKPKNQMDETDYLEKLNSPRRGLLPKWPCLLDSNGKPKDQIMDEAEVFEKITAHLGTMQNGSTVGSVMCITRLLNDLHLLNYRSPMVVNRTTAVLLVHHLCRLMRPSERSLVPRCAQLIVKLIKEQNLTIEGRTLTLAVQWCCYAIEQHDKDILLDVLKALEALIRNSPQNVKLDQVIKCLEIQINAADEMVPGKDTDEIILAIVKCVEASTAFVNDFTSQVVTKFPVHFKSCALLFIYLLGGKEWRNKTPVQSSIVETCLLGLQNVVTLHKSFLEEFLNAVLGIIKSFMVFNLGEIKHVCPNALKPSTLSIPEISSAVVREKTGGKVTKQRKQRAAASNNRKKDKRNNDEAIMDYGSGYIPATPILDCNSDSSSSSLGQSAGPSFILIPSDSDFSDNDGGRRAKSHHYCGKVRQAALNLFYQVVKRADKSEMFLYWSNFIPDHLSPAQPNLVTCILEETSVRGRMCALNVLLALLTSSKMYLLQAESSEKTSSFTPFSVSIGLSLTELHRCLCLALNQASVPVLTQVLKCLAALVQATPYHRMGNGLITKIIGKVKRLIYHKDASVQVTALIVTGCILALEPPIPETMQVIVKVQQEGKPNPAKPGTVEEPPHESPAWDSFDYALFSSDEEDDDEQTAAEIENTPWLLQKCLRNLGVTFSKSTTKDQVERTVPAPVKLESLQVLAAMSMNYFESLIVPHLHHVVKALEMSFTDQYADLRLHAGRAVDFFGQAMARNVEKKGNSSYLDFWQTLLKGPFVNLLQDEKHATLRAVGCDCIGSIGPHIFEQLPRYRQILCVTLLFACVKDEENTVRGAAVRALGLCVLYHSLREDPGFVADTAESILEALNDTNLTVRVKASWSLGNLSDALVLNSKSNKNPDDRLPDKVFLKLLAASVKSSSDSDKIKMNIVRAIGNLVQLCDARLLQKDEFKKACEQAISTLVTGAATGANMKVRWNACYALGNVLKNAALYTDLDVNLWQAAMFNTLCHLVVEFKNFKVRINAALALASPDTREHYGPYFIPVWTALLKALENSENIDSFSEYKHRDQLGDQICLTICRLPRLLAKEDLPPLESILNNYGDLLKTHMHKVQCRLVAEKSVIMSNVGCTLLSLHSRIDITRASEKEVVERLQSIFLHK